MNNTKENQPEVANRLGIIIIHSKGSSKKVPESPGLLGPWTSGRESGWQLPSLPSVGNRPLEREKKKKATECEK